MIAMIRNFLLLALVASPVARAFVPPSCDLQCSNGGYCTLVDGTADYLSKQVQSGKLIETCVCQPKYTGVACENIVQHCSLPDRKCHNGAPCEQDLEGNWMCNCELADSISPFAGKMCRKPYTEYCSGKFIPNSALSFCTNGGRCIADFISAQIAPGDTSRNRDYQHAGCSCPPEFYGRHCEFLRINMLKEADVEEPSPSTEVVQKDHVTILLSLSLFCTALLVITAFVYRRQRKKREEELRPPFSHIVNLSPRKYDDEDDTFHTHPILSKDKETYPMLSKQKETAYSDYAKEEDVPFGDDSTLRKDIDQLFMESRTRGRRVNAQ